MSTASLSTSSQGSSLAGSGRKMAISKTRMEIRLRNHFRSKVYNSGSAVDGEIAITAQRDVRFDSVHILLLGLSTSRLEGVSVPQTTTHTLLRLAMPIPESTYPVPRVLEAGRTYTIPFHFVVPNHLTMGACGHLVDAECVREHHLCLPPTMGGWERDDMAPDVAGVEYVVRARVMRDPADAGGLGTKIIEASQEVKVLPTFAELPPLSVARTDRLYRMSKTKTLRKNILASRLGSVTASAEQPSAIVLRSDGLRASDTTARVQLVFDPASPDVTPPKISAVSGKITAYTFYGSTPMTSPPDRTDTKQFATDRRGMYSTSVALSTSTTSALLGSATWEQRLRNPARRDSGYSSGDHFSPDENDNGSTSRHSHSRPQQQQHHQRQRKSQKASSSPVFHACTVDVPIRLPTTSDRKTKTFIPTFYSCITARVYSLQLTLTLWPGGAGAGSTTLTLTLPLQIAAEPGAESLIPAEELPDFETALQEAEADDHMRPRTISVPELQFRETSVLPGYGE